MGLQKGKENAAEPICCPHFKKTTLPNVLVSIKLFSLCLAVSIAELFFHSFLISAPGSADSYMPVRVFRIQRNRIGTVTSSPRQCAWIRRQVPGIFFTMFVIRRNRNFIHFNDLLPFWKQFYQWVNRPPGFGSKIQDYRYGPVRGSGSARNIYGSRTLIF